MAVHFIGFRGDEYNRAVKVFGLPDFIHRCHDNRLRFGGEVAPGDTLVFANGHEDKFTEFTFNDSNHF